MEINRPFIITKRQGDSLLPPDCEEFNETIEDNIRFLQSSNIFIICAFLYQCIRFLYYFIHYRTTCYTYAILCLVIVGGNIFWIASSTYGFLGINSRSSSEIGKYLCLTSFVLAIRLITYFLVWALMQGYAQQYNILSKSRLLQESVPQQPATTEITDDQKQEIICGQLYQGTLMMVQAIIETMFLGVIIYFVVQVKKYITNYESNQKKKQRTWNLQASIV
ncbi:unnamed protein product (macronuclear) [Paramecium tetraurelia]|uniref:Transmembrane protein n=1 Tax=Paramecium tetraurelia TaxID=5888 RepID=A0E5S9_PARTE|nr:uncharacterized protein GSPATT00003508001 [Paramecium tetraurelia]CAK90646.1 unnamed protein product [Paramecium tetraurelia]|eukprot:XP_001458043.1 hypothetical protein (macronuclear) [Paramecium tetraurelia strain d4-2]